MIEMLLKKGVNQIYCIGGDGTHEGAQILRFEIEKKKLPIVVCCIPKTIDNDIPLIDKSFGFESSVEAAEKIIEAANVESEAAEYGIGLVKVMGRHAGFIARDATLASRDVNFCLVPEIPFELEIFYEAVIEKLRASSHCTIVVAEGADDAIWTKDGKNPLKEGDDAKDASGNILHAVSL
jgi:6-phosphofructokinase 1